MKNPEDAANVLCDCIWVHGEGTAGINLNRLFAIVRGFFYAPKYCSSQYSFTGTSHWPDKGLHNFDFCVNI